MTYQKLELPYFNETQKRLYKIYIRKNDIIGIDGIFNQVISNILQSIIIDLKQLKGLIMPNSPNNRLVETFIKTFLKKYKKDYQMI